MLFLVTMMEYIEINWLRKYMNKVRSSQAYISIDSCTELSKTVLPTSTVKGFNVGV